MLRAVLDTNVVLDAKLSANPQSPNAEIMTRWMAGELMWLVSEGRKPRQAASTTTLTRNTP